jgi:hypothetical protein
MVQFKYDFNESEQFFDTRFEEMVEKTVIVEAPKVEYSGSYEIIPSTEIQTVECSGKYMIDDLVCKEIPYYEVSNNDGLTVYIGKENINGD